MGYWGGGLVGRIIEYIPTRLIYPFIFITAFLAAYAGRVSLFDVGSMCVFGFVGYVMKKFEYSAPAFIVAFILGSGAENALRQSMHMSDTGMAFFLERPIALAVFALGFVVFGFQIFRSSRSARPTAGGTA